MTVSYTGFYIIPSVSFLKLFCFLEIYFFNYFFGCYDYFLFFFHCHFETLCDCVQPIGAVSDRSRHRVALCLLLKK